MNFTHLKNAVAVAKYGSINKAAEELYVSQPCLSNSIKALERDMNFQIFKRTSTGVLLTKRGEDFIKAAEACLREYRKIEAMRAEGGQAPLQIETYPLSYLSNCFLRFRQKHPQETDAFSECGNFDVFERISSGAARLGFVLFAQTERFKLADISQKYGCRCEELFAPFNMYVTMKKNHPLAKYRQLSLETLKRTPLVLFNDASTQNFLKGLSLPVHKKSLFINDRRLFFDAIQSGDYVSFMSITEQSKSQDFAYIPVDDERFLMGIYYVTPKSSRITARERAFLNYLKQEIKLL